MRWPSSPTACDRNRPRKSWMMSTRCSAAVRARRAAATIWRRGSISSASTWGRASAAKSKRHCSPWASRSTPCLNQDASLEQFLAVRDAKWNAHPGPHMMLNFDEQSRDKFGQEAIEIPLPFGVAATDRFYAEIAAAVGVDLGGLPCGHRGPPRRGQCRRRRSSRAPARAHSEGKNRPPRCAFNVGSMRSFDLRNLAHEEMGEPPFFDELGIERTIFIQGPQDAGNRDRTAGVLAELGITDPFVVFPDPGSLAKHITPGEFDVLSAPTSSPISSRSSTCRCSTSSNSASDTMRSPTTSPLLDSAMFQSFYRHFEPADDISGPVE